MKTERFDFLETPIESGRTLIEASAGTGKTFAITALVLRLVLEGYVSDLRRLLVVTFTVAATDELKTRIRTALRHALLVFTGQSGIDPGIKRMLEAFAQKYGANDEDRRQAIIRLQSALQRVDEAGIFTIHGFCKRVLEQTAFESGTAFALNFVEEAKELLSRAATDFWHRHGYENGLLAALAVDRKWGGTELLDHYYNAVRYPETRILPEIGSVDETLVTLHQALEQLAELWDINEVDRHLSLIDKWKKNAKLGGPDRQRYLERVLVFAQGGVAGNLDAITACSPANIKETAYKRGKAAQENIASVIAHPAIMACGAVLEAIERAELSVIQAFIQEVGERFERLKREQEVLTFDDQLRRLYHALRDPANGLALVRSIQEQYAVALIDEFQDTDPFQYDIFYRAFEGCPVFVIGDPKQAIYAFRGADIFAYLQAHQEADRMYSLGKNWRSTTRLVKAVNALFKNHPRPFLYGGIPFDEVEAAGRVDEKTLQGDDRLPLVWMYFTPSEAKPESKTKARPVIVQAVVREIQRLLSGDMQLGDYPLQPGDIAVLVRKNREATEMQDALRSVGIPSVVSKSGDIMKSREMQELEYLLHAIAQPQDSSLLRAALATELWGYTATQIHRVNKDETAWSDLVMSLRRWQQFWRSYGLLRMIYRFMEEAKVTERLLKYVDGERRMTNVRHCIELLHEAEQAEQRSIEELLHWLGTREVRRLMEGEKAELRLESDARAVQISTIHGSKGLEYEIVFCPYLWDGRAIDDKHTPLVHTDTGIVYDLGSSEREHHKALAEAERMAEDLRLAYVALTRAKHRCYVIWGPINGADISALGYLLHGKTVGPGLPPHEHVAAAKARTKEQLMQTHKTLEAIAVTHPDLMMVEPIAQVAKLSASSAIEDTSTTFSLHARVVPEAVKPRLKPWGTTSFSSWTATSFHAGSSIFETQMVELDAEETDIFAFAAGATAGQCLHEIIQRIDFSAVEDKRTAYHVRQVLQKYGLDDPRRHRAVINPEEVVHDMLKRLVHASLPKAGFTLADIGRAQRLNEWEFVLPLASLTPAHLADTFAIHATETLSTEYVPLLQQLDAEAVGGFFKGIADLVFEHEGLWYLVDWKSNHLGSSPTAYNRDALLTVMATHHYALQYHLYCVALHRYLQTRLTDYDYGTHFGGVWCVFLRGLDGQQETGLYYDRPCHALIEALDNQIGSFQHA